MAKLSFGGMYFSTAAATTLTLNTPAKALGTTTAMELGDFTMPANNRLTYTAATTRSFEVIACVSMSAAGATNSTIYIAKNDSVIAASAIQRKISTGGDIGALAVSVNTQMDQNDYVELWLENDDGDNMTVENGTVTVKVLG